MKPVNSLSTYIHSLEQAIPEIKRFFGKCFFLTKSSTIPQHLLILDNRNSFFRVKISFSFVEAGENELLINKKSEKYVNWFITGLSSLKYQ